MNLYPIIILAGGLATRLYPVTKKIPKALVEVGGQPFIHHQLRLLRFHGFNRVIISAWYRGDMIRDYVGDGKQFAMDVEYVFDGDTPLGTGGAIRKALPKLNSPFFVMYGDSYLPCNYVDIQAFFCNQKQPALMTTFRNQGKWDTSNVEMADGRILRYDKRTHSSNMQHIDYGLGVFVPSVFDESIVGQSFDLVDVYQRLAFEKKLLAYEVQERFYEVGSFEGLRELDALLTKAPDQFMKKEKL